MDNFFKRILGFEIFEFMFLSVFLLRIKLKGCLKRRILKILIFFKYF